MSKRNVLSLLLVHRVLSLVALPWVFLTFAHRAATGTDLPFTFTPIAMRADGFYQFLKKPAIADSGSVLFYGSGSSPFYVGDGVDSPLPVVFPSGGGGTVYPAAINSLGQAASTVNILGDQQAVVRVHDDTIDLLDRKPSGDLRSVDINESGQVSYVRYVDPGLGQIIIADGVSSIVAANDTVVGSIMSYFPAINNLGQVAFAAGGRILVGEGGEEEVSDYTLIADTNGEYSTPYAPDLNDSATVTWRGRRYDNRSKVVLYGNGGPIHELVDDSADYAVFGDPTINNSGLIAFKAALDDGTEGIYTGPDPITDRIIASGEELDGSTVTALRFARNGLNNHGEIAFWALMLDGSEGIFRATPIAGDMDRNGDVNFDDISEFVTALTQPPAYQSAYRVPASLHGDTDGDMDLDFDDIEGLVNLLLLPVRGGDLIRTPEPSSLTILGLGGTCLLWTLFRNVFTRGTRGMRNSGVFCWIGLRNSFHSER